MPGKAGKHRSASVKQVNKQHNTLGHKSKGQVRSLSQGMQLFYFIYIYLTHSIYYHLIHCNHFLAGRSTTTSISRKAKHKLSRIERRNQVKVVRAHKKEKNLDKKRSLGTEVRPPFLVCVIVLSPDINPRQLLAVLSQADPLSSITTSKTGNLHIRYYLPFSLLQNQ